MENDSRYLVGGYSMAHIRNRQEPRVVEIMNRVLPARTDFCGCRICVEDVYALTLTKLPAHYVQAGAIILGGKGPTEHDIEDAVSQAVDAVREHPNHPPER